MNDFPGFQTKTISLDGIRLEVPTHWITGRRDDGRPWAGDRSRTATIYCRAESLGVWNETTIEQSRPTANTEPYVAQTVDFLKTIPLLGEIEIDRIQSGFVVHAITEEEEDGRRFRLYRWYSIVGRSHYVNSVRLALEIEAGTAEEASAAWLVRHFRVAAHDVDPFARTPGGSDPLSLKDLSVDDLFGIRIPDDWSHDVDERGRTRSVWCYPRDPRLGKLLIAYEHADLRPEFAEGRDPDVTNKLADTKEDAEFVENEERRRLSRARYAAPLGVILRFFDDEKPRPYAEEDIDRLYVRHHQWFYVVVGRRESLVAFFNLAIPLRWIARPAAEETVALIEREIRALRLLPAFDR
ncbi:MAG: hypothetical protein AB7S71_21405 [Dongiaceae bacterium]